MLHFLLMSVKGLLRNTEKVAHLLDNNCVFIFGEVIFKSHEMGGFFESKTQFFCDKQEVIIVDFVLFTLFQHCICELGFDLLELGILNKFESTLLSLIQTSLLVIKIL